MIGGDVETALRASRTGIRYIADWERYHSLNTKQCTPAATFDLPTHFTRKRTRTMGRVALLVSERALNQAGLNGDDVLTNGGQAWPTARLPAAPMQ